MGWPLILAVFWVSRLIHGVAGICPDSVLENSADMLSKAFCGLYTDTQLAKLNAIYLALDANIVIRGYDAINGWCGDPEIIPIRQWLPLMLGQDHQCDALIAVTSTVGTDRMVTVGGYVEHRYMLTDMVQQFWMVFTPYPSDACNVLVKSITMNDLRCVSGNTPTLEPTTSSVSPTSTEVSSTSSPIDETSKTSSTTSSPTSSRKTYVSDDRYQSVTTTGIDFDSEHFMNSPLFIEPAGNLLSRICRFKTDELKLIQGEYPRAQADLVCLRAGLRLAKITEGNLREAITMVGACLGEGKAAWIKGYWRKQPMNACLEVRSGKTSRSGGIVLSSNCQKGQAVLCQDPFFQV